MLTQEQIQSIRTRNGIKPEPDQAVSSRAAELDSAWATPAPTPAPTAQPGVIERTGEFINKNISEPVANTVIGAAKGAMDTVATVPLAVNKVVGQAVGLGTDKQFNEARQMTADSTNKLLDLRNKHPKGSPEYNRLDAIFKKAAMSDQQTNADINQSQNEVNAEIGGLAEKPGFITPQGTAQKVGFAGEKVGEFVYAGKKLADPAANYSKQLFNEKTVGMAISPLVQKLTMAGIGSIAEGVSAGIITAAQGKDLKDIGKATMWSTILSAPFKLYGEFSTPAADALKGSAEKSASQALGATTKENKRISDKVVPELLNRRVTFLTRGGLEQKAGTAADAIGDQIDDAWGALPPNTKTSIAPIIKNLEDAKSSLMITGTTKVPEAMMGRYQALQNIQKEIIDVAQAGDDSMPIVSQYIKGTVDTMKNYLKDPDVIKSGIQNNTDDMIRTVQRNIVDGLKGENYAKYASEVAKLDPSKFSSLDDFYVAAQEAATQGTDDVSAFSIRSFKQLLDKVIGEKKGGFGLTGAETDKLYAQKMAANAMRNVLNDDHPNIAKLNKEFNFWSNVQRVVGDTVKRTKSQGSLGEDIAEGTGAVVGAVTKGTFGNVLLTATGLRLLKRAISSPAWRMVSGIVKDSLADALASGKTQTVLEIANRIINAHASGAIPESQTSPKEEKPPQWLE